MDRGGALGRRRFALEGIFSAASGEIDPVAAKFLQKEELFDEDSDGDDGIQGEGVHDRSALSPPCGKCKRVLVHKDLVRSSHTINRMG